MRLRQIVERGLRAMDSAAERHNADKVYEELPRHFLTLALEGADITSENAHAVFEGAIRNVEGTFVEQTHYVPCAVVMHRKRDIFTIGPVTFILRERFFKENDLFHKTCARCVQTVSKILAGMLAAPTAQGPAMSK